jgi:hypothetical protein
MKKILLKCLIYFILIVLTTAAADIANGTIIHWTGNLIYCIVFTGIFFYFERKNI